MLYDLFRNKWISGGIIILIIFSTLVIIVIQEDIKTSNQVEREIDETKKIRQWEPTDKAESQQNEPVPEVDDPITPKITDETVDESTEDIPELILDPNVVKYSPHGLGPYPYVSKEFVLAKGLTTWQAVELFGSDPPSKNIELMERILIKLWNDGDTSWTGGVFKNGKVYVNYPNRAYVRYAKLRNLNGIVQKDENGQPIRYISRWRAPASIPKPTKEQFWAGDMPEGVEIIDMDNNDVGIEPYSFLGLDK